MGPDTGGPQGERTVKTGIRRNTTRPRQDTNSLPRVGVVAIIVLGVLLLWDVVGPFGLWKLQRMKAERQRLYLANVAVSKENAALAERIEMLQGDADFQERVVRTELGWVAKGEFLYQFHKKGGQ